MSHGQRSQRQMSEGDGRVQGASAGAALSAPGDRKDEKPVFRRMPWSGQNWLSLSLAWLN